MDKPRSQSPGGKVVSQGFAKVKKNPNFGGGNQQQQQQQSAVSSDDDIPVGFSRRKRLSSTSSFSKKFDQPKQFDAPNIVTLSRKNGEGGGGTRSNAKSINRGETIYQEQNIEELNQQIRKAKEEEEDRIHMQTEAMLEQKREAITARLKDHEETIRIEKEIQKEKLDRSKHHNKYDDSAARHRKGHHHQHHNNNQSSPGQNPYMGGWYGAPPAFDMQKSGMNLPFQMPPFMYGPPPGAATSMYGQPFGMPSQYQPMQYPPAAFNPPTGAQGTTGHNYFQPQLIPNLPQYTNLDIPAHLDQSIKNLRETLSKLQNDNQTLKAELAKNQVINADLDNNLTNFDKDKYQLHAQNNLKLKQQVEDMKRKEIELKSRISSLQANKQYLHGRTNNLGMDIDAQDKQEEALNKQINEFNGLIREKETYIKQLMNELNSLKENKEQFQSELGVLSHKEEFLVNELIFKEDQLNEIMMNNEEMRRKINSGQSQSKYLQSENERLKKESSQLKEENAVVKASTDYLNNELMGLNEHVTEYEHKLVLAQNTIEQLQRSNQQDKSELAHYNATISNQQKAYEELKNQLQIINERNSRIGMQNEMMVLRQQQQQEALMMQMSIAQQQQRMKEEAELQKQEAAIQAMETYSQHSHPSHPSSRHGRGIQEDQNTSYIPPQTFEQPPIERPTQRQRVQIREQQIEQQSPPQNFTKRDGSPYEEIARKSKVGTDMMNTLRWGNDEDEQPFQRPNQNPAPRRSTMQTDKQVEPALRNHGQAMAGLLSWDDKAENQFVNRHSNSHKPSKKDLEQSPPRRSQSGKRNDVMNDILKWVDGEGEEIKGSPKKREHDPNVLIKNHRDNRSISGDRKRREGQQMAGVLGWGEQESLTVDERPQMRRQTEKARQPKPSNQEIRGESPSIERKQIREKHTRGQDMAGLLSFEAPQESAIPRESNANQSSKYGQITISVNPSRQAQQERPQQNQSFLSYKEEAQNSYNTPNRQDKYLNRQNSNQNSAAKLGGIKKIGVDLGKVDNRALPQSQVVTPKGGLGPQNATKNYGKMTEQIHKQQIQRKENLDKFLLQMQIEKSKMATEMEKIGDFPKTIQQQRRKEELKNEIQILDSNMSNIKNQIKMLKT